MSHSYYFSLLFSCTHTDRFCFRDLELLPGQRSTHVNWILQPLSCFIKRTSSAQSSLSSLLILSTRDIGEYLRDEVLAKCSPRVQMLTHFSGNALLIAFVLLCRAGRQLFTGNGRLYGPNHVEYSHSAYSFCAGRTGLSGFGLLFVMQSLGR